jgi:hypothetical protein
VYLKAGLYICLVCALINRFHLIALPGWIEKISLMVGVVLLVVGMCAKYVCGDLKYYPIIGRYLSGSSVKIKTIRFAIIISFALLCACGTSGSDIKLDQITESSHFIIYSHEEGQATLKNLSIVLEDNYERITSLLQVVIPEKSKIYVYPDLRSFHGSFTGVPADLLEDWMVGTYRDGKILMTSPDNPGPAHDYDSLMEIVVHEFVHLATAQISESAPLHLNEGLAVTLAEQEVNVKDTAGAAILNGTFLSMGELDSLPPDVLYPYGYALIEYVVSEYGYGVLLDYYKHPDISTVFSVSEEDFRVNWMAFIEKKYALRVEHS